MDNPNGRNAIPENKNKADINTTSEEKATVNITRKTFRDPMNRADRTHKSR